jgi:hypothetical protein
MERGAEELMDCQWLPYLNRCRCGWRIQTAGDRYLLGILIDMPEKKREIEKHLGRPVNKNEICETKVSINL